MMAVMLIIIHVQLYLMEMLLYLVVVKKNDKSLLYPEMELNGSIISLLISWVEYVISIAGLSSSALINRNPDFAELGIPIIISRLLQANRIYIMLLYSAYALIDMIC